MAEHDLKEPEISIRRIMWGGTIWFAVQVLTVGVTVGFLLGGGWRPTSLPPLLAILWWLGALAVLISLFCVGWAGCPVLEKDITEENASKSKWMPPGIVLFLSGSAVALFAVMLGPVH